MINKLIVDRYIDLPVFDQSPPAVTPPGFPADFVHVPNRDYQIRESNYRGKLNPKGAQVSAVQTGQHGSKVHRNFRWLPWICGKVSCVDLAGSDILTGKMSGCWLTVFTYNGTTYAGHIGTYDSATDAMTIQAQNAWRNAINGGAVTPVKAFNPCAAGEVGNITTNTNAEGGVSWYGAFEPNQHVYTVTLTFPMSMSGHGGGRRARIAHVYQPPFSPDVTAF